jgi:multimeric flavodoxin WrbA
MNDLARKKRITLIHPGSFGGTQLLAAAFCAGANNCAAVEVASRSASVCSASDLLASDALVFATPEHFGYMAGTMKAMFDHLFYRCMSDTTALGGGVDSLLAGRAYGIIVCAGNDGTGAAQSMSRIIAGWRMRQAFDDIIARRVGGEAGSTRGDIRAADLQRCFEHGQALAEALAMGAI